MTKSLLDTDILSEILRNKNPVVAARAAAYRYDFSRYTISSVTVMEVVCGYKKAGKYEHLEEFRRRLARVEILSFDAITADLAGCIDSDLQSSGQVIGRADPMIAAIAINHDLVLVTGNTKHYQRIQALNYPLQLENWRVAAP
ncbi:PIN domain-containing protein [Bythopirellula polymerisocia]|uniref:tRNA(fMet)-specific endonuclease VapC n=1 Tax=Bythopirellula polymerisocia TaxID=2528003 RepID=A0A5C6CNY8_9BACT|nr:PIN domain-containing protein [Bythopirellula polymerisocia]TWU25815.1 tRNA(fMet)-specific endonuclease VapC [Bythopirellula polymerisocia]